MSVKKYRVYIVLPVHNRREITRKFIESLVLQTLQDYHLILLDDGSTDGTADMVAENIQSLTIIRGTGDWWWAGACQKGYECLQQLDVDPQAIVLLINDDVILREDFLQRAVDILATRPATLLLPEGYSSLTGERLTGGAHGNFAFMTFRECDEPSEINVLPSRGLFMRWQDMQRIGNWRPNLLPHYMSDYEYTIRAHRAGLHLYVPKDLTIQFNETATGNLGFRGQSFRGAVKNLFTEKQQLNPIRRTYYVCLVCRPKFMIPFNIAKVWLSALRHLLFHGISLLLLSLSRPSQHPNGQ